MLKVWRAAQICKRDATSRHHESCERRPAAIFASIAKQLQPREEGAGRSTRVTRPPRMLKWRGPLNPAMRDATATRHHVVRAAAARLARWSHSIARGVARTHTQERRWPAASRDLSRLRSGMSTTRQRRERREPFRCALAKAVANSHLCRDMVRERKSAGKAGRAASPSGGLTFFWRPRG